MIAEPMSAPAVGELPAGWRMATFGEMAESITDRIDNPAEAEVDRYVGLEHLDQDTLHVHRWGHPTDVEATKLRFRAGDIIFGRRRAYQRKLAVADFEGICSAHALVLRARREAVVPEYLPVFMQSEVFFKRALEISVGSLSPTINWKTLAVQRFPLPPKEEQRRIADILWAADAALERWRVVIVAADGTQRRLAPTLLGLHEAATARPLRELVVSSAYGPRFPGDRYSERGNVGTVRTTDFDRRGGINLASVPRAMLPGDVLSQHRLFPGDFLLSRSGAYAGICAVYEDERNDLIPAAFIIRFRLADCLLPRFLLHLFQSEFGDQHVLPLARGSAQPNISGSAVLALKVPAPSLDVQRRAVSCGCPELTDIHDKG